MWLKIKNFFREVGIVLAMIADGEMESWKNDNDDIKDDTGPM